MGEDDGLFTPCLADTDHIEGIKVFLGLDYLKFKTSGK